MPVSLLFFFLPCGQVKVTEMRSEFVSGVVVHQEPPQIRDLRFLTFPFALSQQVTLSAHPKQTSTLHKFLPRPPLREQPPSVLHLPPHQLRTWAKLPLGNPNSRIASMVRKASSRQAVCRPFRCLVLRTLPGPLVCLDNLRDVTTAHFVDVYVFNTSKSLLPCSL